MNEGSPNDFWAPVESFENMLELGWNRSMNLFLNPSLRYNQMCQYYCC